MRKIIVTRSHRQAPPDDGMDHADAPMRASQLIGALLIRMVQFARAGLNYAQFPDKALMEEILALCHQRNESEQHLVSILFHLSKLLDDCLEKPQPKLPAPKPTRTKRLPPAPEWEALPLKT